MFNYFKFSLFSQENQTLLKDMTTFNFPKKFLHILYLLLLEGVSGSSNGSSEHLIRAKLLENYDKIVLPVTGKKMEVRFKLRIVKLLKVVSITQQRNRNGNQNGRNSQRGIQGKSG